jgi:DNA primase
VSTSGAAVDWKSRVLQAVDIVELIGRTVSLSRAGRTFKGLCPFHQEKTPSFHVNPARQFYHCFGCKAGGNAIDFVMKRDNLEFVDAMKRLAEEAGIELPRHGVSKQKTGEKQTLFEAHSAACMFFENRLSDPVHGAAGKEYLKTRGISHESVRQFRIGLAPDSWDGLLKGPVGRKFPPEVLALAGLVKKGDPDKGGRYYDTFRNRLMFPIRDESGRVIAFGGRVMPAGQSPTAPPRDSSPPRVEAKYLNSPETPLFSKGRCIFGLDLARQRIVETRTAVVVEGYTDVMMAHQFGVTNVVSVLGTAMTEQHVGVLRRFADRIVLLFDADSAGDAAADRTVGLFLTQPVEIAIAAMPDGLDPDEFLLKNGAEAFESLLAQSPDALAYRWRQLHQRFAASGGDLTGQQKVVKEYLDLLAAARGTGPVDPIRWGMVLTRVSRLTGISVDELNGQFKAPKLQSRRPMGPAEAGRTPTAVADEAGEEFAVIGPVTGRDRGERWILGILLLEPKRWHKVQQSLSPEDFVNPACRRLAEIYWDRQRNEGEPVFNEFLGLLGHAALVELAVNALEEAEGLPDRQVTLDHAVESLKWARIERERRTVPAEFLAPTGGGGRVAPAGVHSAVEASGVVDEDAMLRKAETNARMASVRNKNL